MFAQRAVTYSRGSITVTVPPAQDSFDGSGGSIVGRGGKRI